MQTSIAGKDKECEVVCMNGRRGNNAGFSMVELIIVIAIMAVLMGVLAPTLINNISKSRESTDLHNIDVVRDVVGYALSEEEIAKAHGGTAQYCVIRYDSSKNKNVIDGAVAGGTDFKDLLQEYMDQNLGESVELHSDVASGAFIQIEVSSDRVAVVRVVTGTAGSSATTVTCRHTKDQNGNLVDLISK